MKKKEDLFLRKAYRSLTLKTKHLYQRTDKKILFVIAAIVVFVVFFGIGDIATKWKMEKSFGSDNTKIAKNSDNYLKKEQNQLAARNIAAKNQNLGNENGYNEAGGPIGVGYKGQNMRESIFAVIAIKSTLLIVLVALSIVFGIKISKEYAKASKAGYGIRQLSKKSVKVVKISRK